MFKTNAPASVANAYVDKNVSTSTPGTKIVADDQNIKQDELTNAVESAALALDATGAKRAQLAQAINILGASASAMVDTGVADAYVVDHVSSAVVPPDALTETDGFVVVFIPSAVNTGAATLDYAGLGVKPITTSQGAPLTGGEMERYVAIQYNLTSDRWELMFSEIARNHFYDNTTSGLAATDAQAALDEIDAKVGGSTITSVGGSVSGSAITLSLNAASLDFRDTVTTSGLPIKVNTGGVSMVVSSGSTLGTIDTIKSKIVIVAINNAGTIELACINIAGGVNLDETALINTVAEGGAGGADLDNVFYSTTARTGVAFRVIGYVESTQAVAGTWDTAPTLVQGAGGQSIVPLIGLGSGKWQDLSGSRADGVTYYNTSGKPLAISIAVTNNSTSVSISILVNGETLWGTAVNITASSRVQEFAIIPIGSTYSADMSTNTLFTWQELR